MTRIMVALLILFPLSCSHEIRPGQLSAGPQPVDPNAVISGTVALKEGIKPRGAGTLFIIARPKGVESGPPLAVKRVEAPVFPIGFQMSEENVMLQGNRFAGDITLMAKWSKEGSPMTTSPGDLAMSAVRDVRVGTRGITLVLDQEE